jgi:hypothetical protein
MDLLFQFLEHLTQIQIAVSHTHTNVVQTFGNVFYGLCEIKKAHQCEY